MDRTAPPTAVTIRDLARALELSHTTVSRALADHPAIKSQTKARVRELARELGYVPNGSAQTMRGQHAPTLGLIVPDIQNDFYASIAKIVADAAGARGFQLALSITEDDPEREMNDLRALIAARAAGIVITPSPAPRPQTLAWLRQVNAAQLVRQHGGMPHDAVVIDDFMGVGAATRHLVHYGHRRIAYIGTDAALSCGEERLAGFRSVMIEHGLDAGRVALGHPRPAFAHHAVHTLMAGAEPPTALVMGSSSLTIGALQALRSLRLGIPGDVSIVGYGDPVWYDLLECGLTTVRLPVQEMGHCVTSLLLSRLGPGPGGVDAAPAAPARQASRFPPSLVLRGSTRPLRAA